MTTLRIAALVASIAVVLGSGGAAHAQELTKIAIGKVIGGVGLHIPSYIAMDKGLPVSVLPTTTREPPRSSVSST